MSEKKFSNAVFEAQTTNSNKIFRPNASKFFRLETHMKILVKKRPVAADPNALEDADGTEEAAFEIPAATVATISGLLTLILTFATGVSPLIKYWLIDARTEDVKIELERAKIDVEKVKADVEKAKLESEVAKRVNDQGNYKLALIKQALQNTNAEERAKSLKLLLATDLLKDTNGELKNLVNNPAAIPHFAPQSNSPNQQQTKTSESQSTSAGNTN